MHKPTSLKQELRVCSCESTLPARRLSRCSSPLLCWRAPLLAMRRSAATCTWPRRFRTSARCATCACRCLCGSISRDGRLIAQIGEYRRIPASYEDIPIRVQQAFLAAEDDRFFEHHGVDYAGLMRATLINLVSGQPSQGGGTITMQLARNMFLTPERRFDRKLKEIFLSFRIEQRIQQAGNPDALSQQDFPRPARVRRGGRRRGVFRQDARRPDARRDGDHRRLAARALARQSGRQHRAREVASRCTCCGACSRPDKSTPPSSKQAIDAPMDLAPARARESRWKRLTSAKWRAAIAFDALRRNGLHGGLKVVTTIDSRLQQAANGALRLGLIEYDRRHGYRGPLAHMSISSPGRRRQSCSRRSSSIPRSTCCNPPWSSRLRSGPRRSCCVTAAPRTIDWPGIVVGAARRSKTVSARNPSVPRDVVKAGDIVYVIRTGNDGAARPTAGRRKARWSPLDPRGRRDRRAQRRVRFLRQQVQPRDPGASPAGLSLQALHLFGRARERLHAGERWCSMRRWSSKTTRPRTPGDRRTPPGSSMARRACAKRWCARAISCRCA